MAPEAGVGSKKAPRLSDREASGKLARPRGFEPLAFGFVAGSDGESNQCKSVQTSATTENGDGDKRSLMQPSAGKSKFLAAGLLQVGSTEGGGRASRTLLSVREAAHLLGVCAATVYGLCADGQLPYARISSAIRIVPADLALFVRGRRGQ